MNFNIEELQSRIHSLNQLKETIEIELTDLLSQRAALGQSRTPRDLSLAILNAQQHLNQINETINLADRSYLNYQSLINSRRIANSRPSERLRQNIQEEQANFSQIIENFYLEADWIFNEVNQI